MSEIKHAYRIMVIDIEQDKIVVDEFCDAVVGGVAKKEEIDGKQLANGKVLLAAKCDIAAGVVAVNAAEEAIEDQKKKTLESIVKKMGIGNLETALDKIFGGDE